MTEAQYQYKILHTYIHVYIYNINTIKYNILQRLFMNFLKLLKIPKMTLSSQSHTISNVVQSTSCRSEMLSP